MPAEPDASFSPALHARPPQPTPAPGSSDDTGTNTTPVQHTLSCTHAREGFCPHSPRPRAVGLQPELLPCPNANHSSGIAQKLPRRGRDESMVGKRMGKPIAQGFREILACPDLLKQPGGKAVTLCVQALLGHQFVVEHRGGTASEPPKFFEPAQAAVGITPALSSPLNVMIPIS